MIRRLRSHVLQGVLPLDRAQIPRDVVAGVTLAALAIPSSLGYATIAGMPVVTGLYSVLIPTAIFALLGSSRHLVVGADSATAAILASGLAGLAAAQSSDYVALAGMTALIAGVFLVVARLARLGFIADFLSRTVLIGFLTGVGVQVAVGQIPGLFGLSKQGSGPVPQIWNVISDLPDASMTTVAVSAAVIVVIRGGRLITSKIPWALVAVVGSIIASAAADFADHGITTLGTVPSGLPRLEIPSVPLDDVATLAGVAVSLFVVILAQSAATARAYGARYNERVDENTDLVALGMANAAASVTGTFVVNGSPTKTQMVDSAGGRTQVANLTMSAFVLIVLLFLTGPLEYLPNAVLAAVVFLIGIDLVDVAGMRRICGLRRDEFFVAVLTSATVVFVGVLQGILLAIFLSIVIHLRSSYKPRNTLEVLRTDGTVHTTPLAGHVEMLPGLVVYRFTHSMYFANANLLSEEVLGLVGDPAATPEWFCIEASAVAEVDITAADTLRELRTQLHDRGVRLVIANLADDVRAQLDHYGTTDIIGADHFYSNIADVCTAFRARRLTT